MRVLFVSGIDGACHRYQVLHRAAQLRRRGVASTIRSFVDPRLPADLEQHDLVFLYRVPLSTHVERVIERARSLALPLVGSIDDLLFDPSPEALPSLDDRSDAERALWVEGAARYAATLDACDAFVAPTEVLAEEGARRGWRVHLHRNALSDVELELAERARAGRPRNDGEVVIGYLSGTPTHDQDFAVVAPALAEMLRAHPRTRLLVLGPLRLHEGLASFAERVRIEPLLPWTELPARLAAIDVNLAPLDLGRRFVVAKGEVKYLEAGAVGTPTVASPSPAYRHAIDDRRSGRLAASLANWREALDHLVADRELRSALGEAARLDVLDRWCEDRRASELIEILSSIVSGRSTRASNGRWNESPARRALEPDACPALRADAPGQASPPLGDGQRLTQSFRPAVDGLCRVDLHTVTFGQQLLHRVRLRLEREDESLVAETEWNACDAPDRAWMAFEFPAQEASRDRTFTIVIEAVGTGRGNALSFGLSAPSDAPSVAPEPARLDGAPLPGRLGLRAFADWPAALGQEIA